MLRMLKFNPTGTSALLVLCAILILHGCERNVVSGGLIGLEIGMSKKEVITELLELNVTGIAPVVDERIVVKQADNLELLLSVSNVSGICVSDNDGFSFQIAFDQEDKPRIEYISAPAKNYSMEIQGLESRRDVIGFIGKLMPNNSGLVAGNCILGVGEVVLSDNKHNSAKNLKNFDSWFYYLPDSYSTAVLRFTEGVLTKIEYTWRPFEFP